MRCFGSWFWFVCAALLLAGLTLAACGGDGDGGGNDDGDSSDSGTDTADDGSDTTGSDGASGLPDIAPWTVPADVYATVIDVPAAALQKNFALAALRRGTAPSAATIGIAVPPGTRLLAAQGPVKMRTNGEETQSLPRVILLSTTPVAEVGAFYSENAKDFSAYEVAGLPLFLKGDFEGSPFAAKLSGLPSIQVSEVSPGYQKVWPVAVTEIDIYYQPK